jgi:hypothetical protein
MVQAQPQPQPMPTDHYQVQTSLPGPANPDQIYYTGNPISPITNPAPPPQIVLPPPQYMPPTNEPVYPIPVQQPAMNPNMPGQYQVPVESIPSNTFMVGDTVLFRNREGDIVEVSYSQNKALIDFGEYTNWIDMNALQRKVDVEMMQTMNAPEAPLAPMEEEEPAAPAPPAEPEGSPADEAELAPPSEEPTDEPEAPQLEDEGEEEEEDAGFSFDFDDEVEARMAVHRSIANAKLRAAQRVAIAKEDDKAKPSKKQKDKGPSLKKWDREVQDPETGEKKKEKWWALVSKDKDKNGNIKVFKYFRKVDRKKKDDNKPPEEEVENHKTKIAYFTMKNEPPKR